MVFLAVQGVFMGEASFSNYEAINDNIATVDGLAAAEGGKAGMNATARHLLPCALTVHSEVQKEGRVLSIVNHLTVLYMPRNQNRVIIHSCGLSVQTSMQRGRNFKEL